MLTRLFFTHTCQYNKLSLRNEWLIKPATLQQEYMARVTKEEPLRTMMRTILPVLSWDSVLEIAADSETQLVVRSDFNPENIC